MLGFLQAVLLVLNRQSRGGGRGEEHVCCGHVEAERVTGVGRAVDVDHGDVDPSQLGEMKLGT